MSTDINTILKRLGESEKVASESIKTASAAPTKGPSTDELRGALRTALSTPGGTEKTAAATPAAAPQNDLMKMASDFADAEAAATEKMAAICGSAMCDGFMARWGQYEKAAGEIIAPLSQKTAGETDSFEKFAAENPGLIKEAYDLGYQRTYDALVKQAQADFEQGYNDMLAHQHKTAADAYKRGAYAINDLMRRAQ